MQSIVDLVRRELIKNIDPQSQQTSQNFFKEKIKSHGVKVPVVHKIAKEYFKQIEAKSKAEIFEFCELLWQSEYIEESFVACDWAFEVHKKFGPEDFIVFERWINENVNNWASCDTLCNHTVGEFVEMYPEYIARLKDFAKSKNRWVRRASAVTLIIPARKGKFLDDIFEIAEILLTDKDDLVQKGYGWMLKAASEAHQPEVFNFVMAHKKLMPRTSLRYAVEKMPKDLKAKAMEK